MRLKHFVVCTQIEETNDSSKEIDTNASIQIVDSENPVASIQMVDKVSFEYFEDGEVYTYIFIEVRIVVTKIW